MVKDLHSLIRLQGWRVDEKRRTLGEVLRILESLEARMKQLHEELASEQATAAASPEIAGVFYGNFAKAVIKERTALAESIRKAEITVSLARDKLRQEYQEQKKYETSQEVRDKKEDKERNRLEQIDLDDVGVEIFRQKARKISEQLS